MKWTNRGRELLETSKIICDNANKYYIWGAGAEGKLFIEKLKGAILHELDS